jgi:hypothetical protein
MSDRADDMSVIRSAFDLVKTCAKMTGRSFPEVALQYAVLLRPLPTDTEGRIKWLESVSRLLGELATCYSGPPVSEGEGESEEALALELHPREGPCHIV